MIRPFLAMALAWLGLRCVNLASRVMPKPEPVTLPVPALAEIVDVYVARVSEREAADMMRQLKWRLAVEKEGVRA